jgi:AraC-like DNA-binding protein
MILFGCVLCTLPVIFIGLISYWQSSREIQKQVNRGQMQLLNQINSNVEQTLQIVNHSFNQLVNSTVMNKVMSEPFNANDFVLYRELRREISNVQSSYTKVDDIVIVNMTNNWLIKNSGYYPFDQYLHRNQIANQLLLGNNTSWVLNPSLWFYSEEKANSAECPYTISLVKKMSDPSLGKSGLAFANIPTCRVSEMLNFNLRDSETVFILDDQDRILYHSDPDMIGKYLVDTGFSQSSASLVQNSGQFQTEAGGQEYTASYYRSPFNGWVYMSVISIDSLTREAKNIGIYTTYVCLGLLALFIGVAWIGSRRMYTPIQGLLKQIADKLPRREEKNVNEFQFISEQVQELFESRTELQQEVFQHLQQSRSFFLIKMYQSIMPRQEVLERLEQFGYGERFGEWKQMSVLTLQIDGLEETRYSREDIGLLLFAVGNMVEELIAPEWRLPPVFIDETQVILVGGAQDATEEYHNMLYALTESIQQTIRQVLDLQISIGISLPFSDIRKASAAYRQGLEALKHRIVLGEGVIIQYSSLHEGKSQLQTDYPTLTESELIDAIALTDEDKAREVLRTFMKNIFKHELTHHEYQIPMNRFLNRLLGVMQESGIPLRQLQGGDLSLFEELNRLQIAGEIEEWFWKRIILPMITVMKDRHNSQYQNISEKIIDMIHRLYDTDLTMEACAAELHYNANYLSGVFRKETDMTFSEYLSGYRLTMAKKWLCTTNMTIKEISERLQFLNSQNFIRSFRKQEGVTPGQYRESCRK